MKRLKTDIMNFQDMGLRYENNSYFYSDQYSHVCYKQLETTHEKESVPVLGLYTKLHDTDNYQFVGTTSYDYLFVGNAAIVESIRSAVGNTEIVQEYHHFNSKLTWFTTRLVLRNSTAVQNIGDVYPCIEIWNSYNGSKTAELSFGIILNGNRNYLSFRQTLGAYKQRHLQGSRTKLINVIGGYIDNINHNISEFVQLNCSNILTTETIMKSLDLIKTMGKKRHDVIHKYIAEMISQNKAITSWDMFLAISAYTATERNLNAKTLLENIIEYLSVVPAEMKHAASQLRKAA